MADEETTKIRAAVARALAAEPDVELAYVFGSVATGASGPRSDVDVAIGLTGADDGPADAFRRLQELGDRLERALARAVDAVDLFRAPPLLLHEILRTGRPPVVVRDEARRLAFECRARRMYWDALHLHAEYDRHTFR